MCQHQGARARRTIATPRWRPHSPPMPSGLRWSLRSCGSSPTGEIQPSTSTTPGTAKGAAPMTDPSRAGLTGPGHNRVTAPLQGTCPGRPVGPACPACPAYPACPMLAANGRIRDARCSLQVSVMNPSHSASVSRHVARVMIPGRPTRRARGWQRLPIRTA